MQNLLRTVWNEKRRISKGSNAVLILIIYKISLIRNFFNRNLPSCMQWAFVHYTLPGKKFKFIYK